MDHVEFKVQFKCYWSSFPKSLQFVFETPYMHESEVPGISEGSFDVHISKENEELFIAAKGKKLHVFVADLQNRGSELKHHIIEGDEKQSAMEPKSTIQIMSYGKHLYFVDKVDIDGCLYYRNRIVVNSGNMVVERTGYVEVDALCPSDDSKYHDPDEPPVKLDRSVSDGTSLWLYWSDGKFETSLTEIRPDKHGFMNNIEHTPPPFPAVTFIAAGKVKSEHLADLKPMMNFLNEQ